MTADEAGIISEDAKEWVILRRRAELRKLQRKLAEDEEFEAARQEGRSGGVDTNQTQPQQHRPGGPPRPAASTPAAWSPSAAFTPTSSTWTPAAFTPAGAEVAGLPRQQFRSAA